MRTLWIILASALLGMTIAILLVEPNAAASSAPRAPAKASGACERGLCESLTWLRAPVMRRGHPG